jgi:transcription elongation factor GreA
MAEKTITSLGELLNEEKWTRATLNNYTVNNFKELDEILANILAERLEDETLEECEEHLRHTKNSIIALYIAGIINLNKQAVNDSKLIMLINIFSDNHKWNIVEYLAEKILEYGENKDALRTLAECYHHENQTEKMYGVWERLIRVDFEEADIVRQLAEREEEEGRMESAVDYYKKALHRYIGKKVFNNIREVWHKLIRYAPHETEFFYHAESKIAKSLSPERASQLMEELYPQFKKEENWDVAIEILKRILSYDSKNPMARKEIIECYREKHAGHSHLEEYIKLSNLNQSWRNIHDAIADFEKHISFDAGNFVFHRAWGVGIIREMSDDTLLIDFARKRRHSMSLKMAVSSLDVLEKDHLWVLRSIWKKEKLHTKVKKDIVWALKTVIRSCGNAADIKRIKAELVPSILSQSEWSSWSTKARNILKTNKDFGTLPDKLDHYVVRDQPISFEEKSYNHFKAEKTFFDRVRTINEFISFIEQEGVGVNNSDYFREMFDYFVGFIRSPATVNEFVVCSNIMVRKIITRFPFLTPQELDLSFRPLFDQIDDPEDLFKSIESTDLKRDFLHQIKRTVKEWPRYFVTLFPHYLARDAILELQKAGKTNELHQLFHYLYNNYRDQREAYVWMVKNCLEDDWYKELEFPLEKILISKVHLLDITYRDIDNKRDTTFNRKINRQIHTFLFKDRHLQEYLSIAEESSITRLFTLVSDVKELDPSIVIELKQQIIDRFPNFRFLGETETERVSRGFIVTPSSYERKREQLRRIHEVEVPENSREISVALEMGDLRENAEYKAAKERQEMLNSSAARLKEELETAQIIDKNDIDTNSVSFGTRVRLKNLESGKEESYTILGPWESDPENGIISYLSPLGNELMNNSVEDELSFTINERKYHYQVLEISAAQIT